jgi:RND superfamily putative drug exporter
MFAKIGNFAVKQRIRIIAGWVLIALAMYFFAPSLSEVGTMKESTFLPQDSESLRARELITQYFPDSTSTSSASLVIYDPAGINDNDRAYARKVQNWLTKEQTSFKVENVTSIFTNPQLESRLVSPDKTTMLMNVGLAKAAFESDSGQTTKIIRDYLKSAPEGLQIYVSGQVGIYSDLFESVNKSITLTTWITIILVLVLLIIIFRSPIAALVPLITIGIAFLSARGIIGLIGLAGVSIWSQIDVFLIVMIFGIGTDYCLFLVSRFREELGRGDSHKEAMKKAVRKIGIVVSASALAVVVGLAGMAVARYQMIQTMGPILGVSIIITLLAALTLAPALASIFGPRLFWPRHDNLQLIKPAKGPGFWERVAKITTGRPIIIICIVVIAMVLPYFALPKMNRSFDQLSEIPATSESVAGFKILQNHFDIGEMDPLTAVIALPQGQDLTSQASLSALSRISSDLHSVDGVVKVQSITNPDGSKEPLKELTVSGQIIAISSGISGSFSNSNFDPSILFSQEINSAFTQINGYMAELEQNFSWVKDEKNYQNLQADISELKTTIDGIKSDALVANQLEAISSQIQVLSKTITISNPDALSQAVQSLTLIKNYLDELAQTYPDVKSESSYQNLTMTLSIAQTQLSQIRSLTPEQLQALMSSVPVLIQNLTSNLDTLAGTFEGSNSYLFSQVLAQTNPGSSPLLILQSLYTSFDNDLKLLSTLFEQNGNPVFLSKSLMGSSTQAQDLINLFISDDKKATIMYIVLDSYPQSDAALTAVEEVRTAIKTSLKNTSLNQAEVVIGGTSAELTDVRDILDSDFTHVMIVVLIAIFIVLALLLRSLVAPVYLLITVLLSYGTTIAIVSWIFQGLLGQDGISFTIPIIVFVLLIALGSDYNIFLMSRVKEESENRTTRDGVRIAAIATGGVITACGIILAGTFGALVITPIRTLMQIGAAVAIGVLIDTFVVRALLVPAIASLLGRWNWWPFKHQ